MSQMASLTHTFRCAKKTYGLSEGQCVSFFLDVLGDIEWEIRDITGPYEHNWEAKDRIEAQRVLFGS